MTDVDKNKIINHSHSFLTHFLGSAEYYSPSKAEEKDVLISAHTKNMVIVAFSMTNNTQCQGISDLSAHRAAVSADIRFMSNLFSHMKEV